MVYKRFSLNVFLRVGFLFAGLCSLTWSLLKTHWIVTPLILIVLILLILADLIRYVQKTNRDLSNLLNAIKNEDFASNFSAASRGPSFYQLQASLNQVIATFRNLRVEKEINHQYLQTVIEHVAVALICINDKSEVILMNQAAKNMLHRPYLKQLQALERTHPRLFHSISQLSSGEKDLVKIGMKDKLLHLSVHAKEFKLQTLEQKLETGDTACQEKSYKLISLQNIKTELEENEVEAWQKLIRVLTHEIMNSVTPIISLSSMINEMLENSGEGKLSDEELEDVRLGLGTIESRSKGLLNFVEAYRSLTRVPKAEFEKVSVLDMLTRVHTLLNPDLQNAGIEFKLALADPKITIEADPVLIEQVLINLVKNAKEALSQNPPSNHELGITGPTVEMTATKGQNNKIHLQVHDNGPGIGKEYQDQIFIPFFTTKKHGSGVGLSLSRQIMRMHKGSISAHSVEGKGTIFTLEF